MFRLCYRTVIAVQTECIHQYLREFSLLFYGIGDLQPGIIRLAGSIDLGDQGDKCRPQLIKEPVIIISGSAFFESVKSCIKRVHIRTGDLIYMFPCLHQPVYIRTERSIVVCSFRLVPHIL